MGFRSRVSWGALIIIALLPRALTLAQSPVQRLHGTAHILTPADVPVSSAPPAPKLLAATGGTRADFLVNGSSLPLVDFALPDSWAGLLPISAQPNETRNLFFWYWPTSETQGNGSLTIWLNGGPGCSSMTGFLQENGPISYKPGSTAPSQNNFSWTQVSDMLYVDQPMGTGFSRGPADISGEDELAEEFYGFLTQFYSVFPELVQKNLFLAGESYAGAYIPYIANRIISASPAEKAALALNLQGIIINDGVYSSFEDAPIANFAQQNDNILNISTGVVSTLENMASSCGYNTLLDQIKYPPHGKIPLPNDNRDIMAPGCASFQLYINTSTAINPCFNSYLITQICPTPPDPIQDYFSRTDVQEAIHVPGFGPWTECTNQSVFINGVDNYTFSETLFPSLLAFLPRGITLWQGLYDGLLLSQGARLTIQNLTWGGQQGFQSEPNSPLMVGTQQRGISHSERGLTYIEVANAGHMIPKDQPDVALSVFSAFVSQTPVVPAPVVPGNAVPASSLTLALSLALSSIAYLVLTTIL